MEETGVFGVTVTKIENGKAELELTSADHGKAEIYNIYLWDEKDRLVFACEYSGKNEDCCTVRLWMPHLWEGVNNPCLYRLEVYRDMECCQRQFVALRSICEIPGRGSYLNGQPFEERGVFYRNVDAFFEEAEKDWGAKAKKTLDKLVWMGANTLVVEQKEKASWEKWHILQEYCDRIGLLLKEAKSDACVAGENLFDVNQIPTDLYYQQKAAWSKDSFVYISLQSLRKQADGAYCITVYSNCRKVLLLVNGTIFGFQEDGPEFCFTDIRIKGFPVELAVESQECSMSVLCYGVETNKRFIDC